MSIKKKGSREYRVGDRVYINGKPQTLMEITFKRRTYGDKEPLKLCVGSYCGTIKSLDDVAGYVRQPEFRIGQKVLVGQEYEGVIVERKPHSTEYTTKYTIEGTRGDKIELFPECFTIVKD